MIPQKLIKQLLPRKQPETSNRNMFYATHKK